MALTRIIALFGLSLGAAAQSTAGAYGQCGGSGYTGPTACVSAYTCTLYNDYYAQCVPGSAAATTTTATTSSAHSSTSLSTLVTATSSPTTTTSSGAAASGTATLSSGWYWIRAVESPYFHSYLQSQPTAAPAPAVLDAPATAGQFNIVDGQLVYNTGGSSTQELYLWVEDPTDKTQRALATWFNTTANPYGTFSFSGDTVEWVDPDVSRPNTGAFYVCPNATTTATANNLYINTGAYDYLTPSGCYDVDIHYYNAATATV